jgi:hypothetical protein
VRALVFGLGLVLFVVGCPELTPKDQAGIATDAVRIAMCQEKTRECKRVTPEAKRAATCWPVYDECMVGAGLRDGGAE